MSIVLRTDELGSPKYFAGFTESPFGLNVILSPTPFGAMEIESREDAKNIIAGELDYRFKISELTTGSSNNLKTPTS